MADVLPLNQPLIVLGRRKKKDEDQRRIKAPAAFFLFPALEGGKEEEEAAKAFFFSSPCLRLNQGRGEGGHGLEGRGLLMHALAAAHLPF